MNCKRTLLLVAIGLGHLTLWLMASLSTNAQEGQAFTLQEAQDYAATNSYLIKQAEFDLEASEKKVRETTAIGLPQVNGAVGFNNFILCVVLMKWSIPLQLEFWLPFLVMNPKR